MALTLAQLHAFNAVMKHGSFSRAARALGISQPAITAQIRQIEETSGELVFERIGRQVRPTLYGDRLQALTRQMEDLEEAVNVMLSGHDGDEAPVLRATTATPHICMPMMARFHQAFPHVGLEISLGNTGTALGALRDRSADIGIAPMPEPDPVMDSRDICEQHLVALCPVGHALANRQTIKLRDLVRYPLIHRQGESMTQQLVNDLMQRKNLGTPPGLSLETREAVQEAVAAGLGLSLVLHRDISPDPRLVMIEVEDVTDSITEKLIWVPNRAFLPGLDMFLNWYESNSRDLHEFFTARIGNST